MIFDYKMIFSNYFGVFFFDVRGGSAEETRGDSAKLGALES